MNPPAPAGRSRLQDRIVLFFVGLLLAVQLASFVFIREAVDRAARDTLRDELRVGAGVFGRLLDQTGRQLAEAAATLTYDASFREAVAARDATSLAQALREHAFRTHAGALAVLGAGGAVLADTREASSAERDRAHRDIVSRATAPAGAWGVRLVDGQAVQLAVAPVLAPRPVAWVAIDAPLDEQRVHELERLSAAEVSLVDSGGPSGARLLASTLPPAAREALGASIPQALAAGREGRRLAMGGEEYETLALAVGDAAAGRLHVVLQRPVRDSHAPWLALQAALLIIAGVSLAVTLVGSVRIARRIARPLTRLADAAREIARGNYAVRTGLDGGDEIGELARAFDGMARGLAERDIMRDVLGKVASSEVVEQLLHGGEIELGGQELDASVMFADLRNFTEVCEQLAPRQSLTLLNEYLAIISAAIEEHGGVVDKYLGDGVMAIFGAPVPRVDHAQRAVLAALEIRRRIAELLPRLAARGLPNPAVGIGVNTSRVVAGNIGSPSRLNYTVLGDGVNLASRLEGLTKRYLVPIVAGSRTRSDVRGVAWRELDKVRVRGKSVPERIFEPLGPEGSLSAGEAGMLDRWHRTLEDFREGRFAEARAAFESLATQPGYDRLAMIYLGYLRDLQAHPPPAGWDASFTLYDK